MTNRSRIVLVALVAFLGGGIVGGMAGGYVAVFFTSRFFSDGWMMGNGVETRRLVRVLKNLRSGQIKEATESLELSLDGKIISLEISEQNTDKTNQAVRKAIGSAKEYRTKYPWRSKLPEIDEAVSNVLSQNPK